MNNAMRGLHLTMAGYFAVLLPFICWGALATPGHPHSHPHFVFWSPQPNVTQLPAHTTAAELHALGHHNQHSGAEAGAGHHGSAGEGTAAGRSVPALVIGTVLVPMKLLAAALWVAPQGPASLFLVSAPRAKAVAVLPATPPPKA